MQLYVADYYDFTANPIYMSILTYCLNEKLKQQYYDQALAGFGIGVSYNTQGMSISSSSYSDGFSKLFTDALKTITQYEPTEEEYLKGVSVEKLGLESFKS